MLKNIPHVLFDAKKQPPPPKSSLNPTKPLLLFADEYSGEQCLSCLSNSCRVQETLINYRFVHGVLQGTLQVMSNRWRNCEGSGYICTLVLCLVPIESYQF